MQRTEKLFKFNHTLYIFNKVVENKRLIKKLNKKKEEIEEQSQIAILEKEITEVTAETAELEEKVNEDLREIFKGREKLISEVKIDYDDIHVVEKFQDYMNLI